MIIGMEDRFRTPDGGAYALRVDAGDAGGRTVQEGALLDLASSREVPIRGGLPRFVASEGYTGNFGIQWNYFRETQLDSRNGTRLSAERFFSGTGWSAEQLHGRRVLEVGCGAGRFTEVMLAAGADVTAFDYSNAVDASHRTFGDREDLLLFQGNVYEIPLEEESYDFVFCYGVLQHTPQPREAFDQLVRFLRPGGEIAVDSYIADGRINPSKSKYIWRPLTTRVPPESLYRFLRWFIPRWLPMDTYLKRLPGPGRYVGVAAGSVVPCWNYLDMGLTEKQREEWAVMDTFDALAAAHDHPQTPETVRSWLVDQGLVDVRVRTRGNGVEATGRKRDASAGGAR